MTGAVSRVQRGQESSNLFMCYFPLCRITNCRSTVFLLFFFSILSISLMLYIQGFWLNTTVVRKFVCDCHRFHTVGLLPVKSLV